MRIVAGLMVAALVGGCTLEGFGGVSRNAVFGAASTDALIALGAERLDEAAITAELAGRSFVEPNEGWIWEINADGTQSARAADSEWADAPGGQWQVVDGRFCRENEDLPLKCSEVWKVGPYYRFTEPDGSLAVWTITAG